MGDVVELKRPGERWASGPMRCLRCKTQTTVVRKLPQDFIQDCAECGCATLVAASTFSPSEDEAVWLCVCENTLMELIVSRDGAERLFCIGCGNEKPVKS